MTVVGVFGPSDDDEVRALAERLRARQVSVWTVDLAIYPTALRLTRMDDTYYVDGRPLHEMDAAYLRKNAFRLPEHARYDAPVVPATDEWPALHAPTVRALTQERINQATRTAALQWLAARRPVVNPPVPQNWHRQKTYLLDRLRRAGLPVPAFAVGSVPADLARFAQRAAERWAGAVDKPGAGIYKTHLVDGERQAAHPFSRRPALFQRYIRGDTIRCYVVGGRLVSAARIVHGGTVDSSMSQTGIEVVDLPASAQQTAEGVAAALGLEFCGMDLMHDHDAPSDYYVIDCNLSPMFVNYGKLSRCDIAGHLADHLVKLAARRSPPRRPEVLDLVDGVKAVLAEDPDIARLLARRPPKGEST